MKRLTTIDVAMIVILCVILLMLVQGCTYVSYEEGKFEMWRFGLDTGWESMTVTKDATSTTVEVKGYNSQSEAIKALANIAAGVIR